MAPAVDVNRHLVISIAAGVPTSVIERRLPPGTAVVRAMPNIAALVGQAARGSVAAPSPRRATSNGPSSSSKPSAGPWWCPRG